MSAQTRTPAARWITRALVCVALAAPLSCALALVVSRFVPDPARPSTPKHIKKSVWVVSVTRTPWKSAAEWRNETFYRNYPKGNSVFQALTQAEADRLFQANWSRPDLWISDASASSFLVSEVAVGWPAHCLAGWVAVSTTNTKTGGIVHIGKHGLLCRPVPIGLLINTLLYAPLVALVWALALRFRTRRRRRRGRCIRCAYSIRGLVAGPISRRVLCPECGTSQRYGFVPLRPMTLGRRIATCALIAGSGPVLVAWMWANGRDLVSSVAPWAADSRSVPLVALERDQRWWIVRRSRDWASATTTWMLVRDKSEADDYLSRDWVKTTRTYSPFRFRFFWPDEPQLPSVPRTRDDAPSRWSRDAIGEFDAPGTTVIHRGWGFPFACVGYTFAPTASPIDRPPGVFMIDTWLFPSRPLPIGLALDVVAYALACGGFMYLRCFARRVRGRCTRCSTPLRGLIADPTTNSLTCPECGHTSIARTHARAAP